MSEGLTYVSIYCPRCGYEWIVGLGDLTTTLPKIAKENNYKCPKCGFEFKEIKEIIEKHEGKEIFIEKIKEYIAKYLTFK